MHQHQSGYQPYCRHQPDIHHRVKAWCRAVEQYYWPLGDDPKRDTSSDQPPKVSANQQRAEEAKRRIEAAIAQLRQLGTLPRKIRDLAQQLAQAAHCSLQTVYKHLTLWHPDHTQPPEARRVTVPPENNTALLEPPATPQSAQPSPSPDPPEPLSDSLLHAQERSMKCIAAPSSFQKNPPGRGVRGEEPRFPQPPPPAPVAPAALNPAQHYRPLPPPSSSAAPDEWERYRNQESLRRCLFRLKWGHQQLAQYIAEQFDGKRFYQLMPDEVMLLIYRLQHLPSG